MKKHKTEVWVWMIEGKLYARMSFVQPQWSTRWKQWRAPAMDEYFLCTYAASRLLGLSIAELHKLTWPEAFSLTSDSVYV